MPKPKWRIGDYLPTRVNREYKSLATIPLGTLRSVEIGFGSLNATARPFPEAVDRGPGVPPESMERIFDSVL